MVKISTEVPKKARKNFRAGVSKRLHSKLSPDVDDLIYLDFLIFMDQLVKNTEQHVGRRRMIEPEDIEAVLE
ncbi:hypothetical protein CU098_012171, partial [Rhizopus stolonifer]